MLIRYLSFIVILVLIYGRSFANEEDGEVFPDNDPFIDQNDGGGIDDLGEPPSMPDFPTNNYPAPDQPAIPPDSQPVPPQDVNKGNIQNNPSPTKPKYTIKLVEPDPKAQKKEVKKVPLPSQNASEAPISAETKKVQKTEAPKIEKGTAKHSQKKNKKRPNSQGTFSEDRSNFVPVLPKQFSESDNEKKVSVQGIDAVIKKRPEEVSANSNAFGEVRKLIIEGKSSDALKVLDGMNAKENSEKAIVLYYKGLAFESLGNIKSRNDSFNRAYDLDTKNKNIKRAKTSVLIWDKNYAGARKNIDELISFNPDEEDFSLAYKFYGALNNQNDQYNVLIEGLKKFKNSTVLLTYLFNLLTAVEKYDEALRVGTHLMSLNVSNWQLFEQVAFLHEKMGDQKLAIETCEKSLMLEPQGNPCYQRGKKLLEISDQKDKLNTWEKNYGKK